MRYELVRACYECHAIHKPGVSASDRAFLANGGHPVDVRFEVVKYSQGTVRHRFYPPDIDTNQTLSDAELARWWVAGQVVQLTVANEAVASTDSKKYVAAQRERIQAARDALAPLADLATVKQLLDAPTEANARAVIADIAERDVFAVIGGRLPDPELYK